MLISSYKNRKGFTLAEILTAVLIMSMMMVAVLSFVDYAGRIWHTGQTTVNSKNYARMTFNLMERDILETQKIVTPSLGKVLPMIEIEKNKSFHLIATDTFHNLWKYENITISSDDKMNYNSKVLISKDVAAFSVTRISTWTVAVHLEIQSPDEDEDGEHEILSSDTMILYAPMVGR